MTLNYLVVSTVPRLGITGVQALSCGATLLKRLPLYCQRLELSTSRGLLDLVHCNERFGASLEDTTPIQPIEGNYVRDLNVRGSS